MRNHFFKKFIQIFYFLPVTTLLPVLWRPAFYFDPAIWLATFVGIAFHLFAPYTPEEDILRSRAMDRMSTRLMLLVCCLIYLISIVEYVYFSTHPMQWNWISYLGISFTFLGLSLRVWATRTLGVFFTATIQLKEDQPIVDIGPYQYLRHPAYLSSMLTAVSIPVIFHSVWGVVFFFVGFVPTYLYRINVEESALLEKYGESYVKKMQHIRKLIPFVY